MTVWLGRKNRSALLQPPSKPHTRLKHGEIYICATGVPLIGSVEFSAPSAFCRAPFMWFRSQHRGTGEKQDLKRRLACGDRDAPRTSRPRPTSVKRFGDIFLASLALICLAPFFGAVAIAINGIPLVPYFSGRPVTVIGESRSRFSNFALCMFKRTGPISAKPAKGTRA